MSWFTQTIEKPKSHTFHNSHYNLNYWRQNFTHWLLGWEVPPLFYIVFLYTLMTSFAYRYDNTRNKIHFQIWIRHNYSVLSRTKYFESSPENGILQHHTILAQCIPRQTLSFAKAMLILSTFRAESTFESSWRNFRTKLETETVYSVNFTTKYEDEVVTLKLLLEFVTIKPFYCDVNEKAQMEQYRT